MESTQLALTQAAAVPQTVSPLTIVQQAIEKNMTPESLQALMDFAERYQRNVAKQAYDAAIAKFKLNPPRIEKNKLVEFGNTKYRHSTLDEVVDKVTAALSAVGISHKWAVEQTDKEISVSCILTHCDGHSERTTLRAGADTSGSKNAIQAIGSAVTYLQRYTLLAATGLAADNDDDGKATTPHKGMDEPIVLEWLDAINQAPNLTALKDVFGKAYKAAEALNDRQTMEAFAAAKNKAKEALK